MIQSIKELEKLLKLCRKQGVTEITLAEVSLKLGELPANRIDQSSEEQEEQFEDFPDGPLTPEELTYFANGGDPKDNPYRGKN